MPYRIPKRLLYSLLIVLAWLSFIIEGSHALFSAEAVLSGNAINTGTAGLEVSDSQDPNPADFSQAQPGFNFSLVPGGSQEYYFTLKNTSDAGVDFDIDALASVQKVSGELASAVVLEIVPVDESGDAVGSPVVDTLPTFASAPSHLDVMIPRGAMQRFSLKATLSDSYVQQDEALTFDLDLIGVQSINRS